MLFKKNRRKHPRVPVKADITVEVNGRLLNSPKCTNISLGGMCIQIKDYVNTHEKANILLLKKKEPSLRLEAEIYILWQRQLKYGKPYHEIGVKFLNMDKNCKKQLSLFIKKQL